MSAPTQERDIQHFSRWAATYERSHIQRYFDRVHEALLDLLPATFSPQHILDVGCGTGRLLRRAQARWPLIHGSGIDAAEGMVTQARELTPGATFHVALAEALPLPAASFDSVARNRTLPSTEQSAFLGPVDIAVFPTHVRAALKYLKENEVTRPLRVGGFYVIYKRLREDPPEVPLLNRG